jgi:glycerol-3-phosphate dehydrogenase (NAD(P)+)
MHLGILGGGSWGTALAIQWARHGHHVDLWARSESDVAAFREAGRNTRYLPQVDFPADLSVTADLEGVIEKNHLLGIAIPVQAYRDFLKTIAPLLKPHHRLMLLSKGIEVSTLLLPTQVVHDVLGKEWIARTFVLSGPSFALEVAQDKPTTVVLSGPPDEELVVLQEELACPTFRLYRNDDVIGVEICGALKNVIAIGSGMVAGLDLGHNTTAGLITRGLAEMSRMGLTSGARPDTFAGLAGMGDLILTCTGSLSRNYRVGHSMATSDLSLEEILKNLGMVAEGVHTSRAVHQLAALLKVDMPICSMVYAILYGHVKPMDAVRQLMTRRLKSEAENPLHVSNLDASV